MADFHRFLREKMLKKMPGSFNQTFTKPGSMVVVSRCFSLCKWTYEITVYFLSCQKLWRHFHGFPNTLLIWNMYENRFTFVRSITMIHETYQETPVKIDPKQQHKTPQSAAFALWNRKIQKQLWYQPTLKQSANHFWKPIHHTYHTWVPGKAQARCKTFLQEFTQGLLLSGAARSTTWC